MGQYGQAACIAVDLLLSGATKDPERAWKRAVSRVSESSESQDKPCPKAAFLGLCASGAVNGVQGSRTALFSDNAKYANRALDALRGDPSLSADRVRLWRVATGSRTKSEQGQLDVLLGLWEAGYIRA